MANKKKEHKKVIKKANKKVVQISRPKGIKNKKPVEVKKGRPKGRSSKVESASIDKIKPKRGRPKGSKNKSKSPSKAQYLKKIENDILNPLPDSGLEVSNTSEKRPSHTMLEQILFKLPYVEIPLIGTPQQVQIELDSLAIKMQRNPNDDLIFDKIHLYMHGYLINVVLKKFPFIKGLQTVDIYQETLIALRFKSIPNFKRNKGMSFLNFSKMCIRRHLITLLNASKNRKKDQSMNQSISLDSSPIRDDNDDGRNTFANIIMDNKDTVDHVYEKNEAFEITKQTLMSNLSWFEQIVLQEYLSSSSYREISKNISRRVEKRCNTKSIDNALLRIRKKALSLMSHCKLETLPIFMKK